MRRRPTTIRSATHVPPLDGPTGAMGSRLARAPAAATASPAGRTGMPRRGRLREMGLHGTTTDHVVADGQ